MATPNEKLAASLELLKVLQDRGHRVVRSAALSRTHRERLSQAGYLQEVIKGWYLPARPDFAAGSLEGSTAAWFAGMRDFVAGYCDDRFGSGWHLSPDQSLLLRTGERTLPRQLQVWATAGNNQLVQLPHGCSLFIYRPPALLPAEPHAEDQGIRLVNLTDALVAVSSSFFAQQPLAARVALGMVDDTAPLLGRLLDGSHSVIAGRLAGAFRAVGRADFANSIVESMRSASYTVQEVSPFEMPPAPLLAGRPVSPHVQRLRLNWAAMREAVIAAFPPPGPLPTDQAQVLNDLEERYVADAYHSLSIEGYHVTADLIEKIRNGVWDPEGADRQQRDAMAAKGYFEAYKRVRDFVVNTLQQPADQTRPQGLREALGAWYLALFSPSVQAGLLKPSDLAGWRNNQVFIRGALHVPLAKEAVRECMPVLFELIESEPHPAVRAILGHFLFVFIHPYMDGNGRLARFLMNAMLVTGGYVWTVIPVQQRKAYMEALERASSYGEIGPFASFVARLTAEQASDPLPRPD
ncbi:Fic family protein [Burkholderia cenocepacia]|nr:Fic family protein [Burkholderia cenocepacia]MDI9689797.1 Fic family protein [Burkholderia cenocepacia]